MHELSYILTEVIFILLHFSVFLANYFIFEKKLFTPSVLFSLLWTVILFLHLIFGFTILDELYPITIDTFLILFIGVICFSLGSLIASASQQPNTTTELRPFKHSEFKISVTLRLIFLGIILVGLPLHIQASIRVFLASQIDGFFQGLRTELAYGEEDIGPTKYLTSLSFVVFAINYYAFLKERSIINNVLLIVSLLATTVYAILATGRTYFFVLLAIYLGISYLHKKRFSIKKYVLALFVFMSLFIFLGMIYGKGGDVEDSFKDNLQSSSEFTGIYLVSSINALDEEVQHNSKANYPGENTLRFFIKIGQQLNLVPDKKVASLLSGFVYIPYPTNVFTFYSPYMRDYGKIYAWFMIALFGALHTWIYHKALKKRNLRNTLYYSFLLFPLLMSFFQDQYMSLFSFWLQLIFFTESFLMLDKFFIARKR